MKLMNLLRGEWQISDAFKKTSDSVLVEGWLPTSALGTSTHPAGDEGRYVAGCVFLPEHHAQGYNPATRRVPFY